MAVSDDLEREVRAAWRFPYAATPYDIWTRTNVGEVFPNVVTPLTWSVYLSMASRLLEDAKRFALIPSELFRDGLPPAIFAPIGGRLWYNAGLMHHTATRRFGFPSWFYSLSLGGPREGERLSLPESGWHPLRLLRAAPALLGEQRRQQRVIADFERDAPAMRTDALALRRESLDGLDTAALLARLDRITARATAPYAQLLDGSAAALNAYGLLAWLCETWCGDRTLANDLVTGLGDLLTAQASVMLWEVAQAARGNDAARRVIETAPPEALPARLRAEPSAAAVAAAYARFLDDHGHRAVDEFELSVPRWREDPGFIVATLRTYLSASPDLDPSRHLARQQARRAAAERRARRRLVRRQIDRIVRWRQAVFDRVLAQARRFLPLRENPKHHFLLFAEEMRRTVLALGERLQAAGAIERAGDIFYLMRDDIARATDENPPDLRPRVEAYRALSERFRAWQPPEVIHGPDVAAAAEAAASAPAPRHDVEAAAPVEAGAGRLSGIAASAGVVTGRARVALTPEEGADMEPGEILVAPFTDPGWTPLFTVAGAIVMDLGGLLSHGAIVAREYGIPAVVNTRSATSRIKSGQLVTVDGSTGEVTWE